MKTLSLCSFLTLAIALPLAANVIANPGFESGSGTTSSSALSNFTSPVTSWGGWNNSAVLTTLEVLPSTLPLPDAGAQMLHISSTGDANGVYQFFSAGSLYAGAWFFVNSGQANLWMVDGPGGGHAVSATHGQWEYVQVGIPISTSELAIYTGAGGGDFFVDLVTVEASPLTPESLPTDAPEPATLSLLALGAVSAFAATRRKRA